MAIHASGKPLPLLRPFLAGLALLLLAGSCAGPVIPPPAAPTGTQSQSQSQTQPRPQPVPRTAAVAPMAPRSPSPSLGWQDMPIATGEWRWSGEGGSTARFGSSGQSIALLACRDRAVTLTLTRYGGSSLAQPDITIRTTSTSRSYPGAARPGAVSLTLDSRDPLLDAIVFSRGRFAVEVQGMDPLALPSWPEVARVIDDCRS